MKRLIMFHTYILFSKSLTKYYIGSTSHLFQRLEEHNRGKTPFTRTGKPWTLIYAITCDDKSSAIELEKKIKKRGAERYLNALQENILSAYPS
jgi:putative endonuclease